jgi:hypothetical protein
MARRYVVSSEQPKYRKTASIEQIMKPKAEEKPKEKPTLFGTLLDRAKKLPQNPIRSALNKMLGPEFEERAAVDERRERKIRRGPKPDINLPLPKNR